MPVRALRTDVFNMILEGFDPVTGEAIVRMERLRELLLPGLWEVTMHRPAVTYNWSEVFKDGTG